MALLFSFLSNPQSLVVYQILSIFKTGCLDVGSLHIGLLCLPTIFLLLSFLPYFLLRKPNRFFGLFFSHPEQEAMPKMLAWPSLFFPLIPTPTLKCDDRTALECVKRGKTLGEGENVHHQFEKPSIYDVKRGVSNQKKSIPLKIEKEEFESKSCDV